ncbi:MAG: carbohydrate ABC transporter permease [Candidatus Dormibacteraeota bacterium]|nr:carbohydrate ABC transporter permease [Candidatus Dormibacteraeota bacterium]
MSAPSIPVEAGRRALRSSPSPLRRSLAKLPIYLLLALGAVFALVPFVWMVSTALKTPGQLFKFPPEWVPNPAAWSNFADAWNALPFGAMVLNSVFVTTLAMVGELTSAAVVAYGFARFQFRFRNVLFLLMLSSMMLPWVVTLIPGFLIWKQFGLINTFDPLTVGALFAWGPFYVFLLRQFFLGVSRDIEEAAIVDGANAMQVLWYVMLPLVRPVILAVAVLSFQGNWNNFKGALIYLQEPLTRFTLPLGLQFFQASISNEAPRWHLMMAMSLLMVIPVVILFFLAQRQFIEGIQLGGVKG